MREPLSTALALADVGFRLFPVDPMNKRPHVKWRKHSSRDPVQMRRWWRAHPAAAIGLDLAPVGLVVIDLDRHVGADDGVAAFEALAAGRDLPTGPVVDTPSGGRHLYFVQPPGEALGNARGKLPPGIDVRGAGGFAVAPGSVRPDGAGWFAAQGSPDLVEAFRAKAIPPLPGWLVDIIRPQEPTAILDPLPASRGIPLDFPRERERRYAMTALDRETADLEATAKGGRNDKANAVAFRAGRFVGAGWLDEADARRALNEACRVNGLSGEDARATARTIDSGLAAGKAKPADPLVDRPAPTMVSQTPATNVGTLRLWWHGARPPFDGRKWLVRGMVPERAVGLISGQSGAGKTFVVLDLAGALMTGEPFAGHKVSARGGVLFVAAEGAFEIPTRLKALVDERIRPLGLADVNADALPFAMLDHCPALLKDGKANDATIGALVEAARSANATMTADHGVSLALVVVDTIAASAAFSDENDAAQAQALFGALRRIADATGAVVLGVDHFGKAVETGTRGSSAKEAAADVVLAVLADKDISGRTSNRRLAIRKLRGGEQGVERPFDLRSVDIGQDEDGEPETTLVVDWERREADTSTVDRAPRMSPAIRLLLDAITNAGCEDGAAKDVRIGGDGPQVRAVDREGVRKVFYERHAADGDTEAKRLAAKRQAFKRAIDQAQARSLVGVHDDGRVTWLWLVQADVTTVTHRDTP